MANETLFKLVSPGTPARLAAKEIEAFRPYVLSKLGTDDAAKGAASKMVSSFAAWTDAAHFYRHAQKEEQPSKPPIELAVALVAQGGGFLRLFAGLEN